MQRINANDMKQVLEKFDDAYAAATWQREHLGDCAAAWLVVKELAQRLAPRQPAATAAEAIFDLLEQASVIEEERIAEALRAYDDEWRAQEPWPSGPPQ